MRFSLLPLLRAHFSVRLLALAFAACAPRVISPEPPPEPVAVEPAEPCAAACTNLRRLGCSDGTARPGEDSCEELCRRAEATGLIDLRLRCVTDARDKAAVLECRTYRCP